MRKAWLGVLSLGVVGLLGWACGGSEFGSSGEPGGVGGQDPSGGAPADSKGGAPA